MLFFNFPDVFSPASVKILYLLSLTREQFLPEISPKQKQNADADAVPQKDTLNVEIDRLSDA